MQYTRVVIRTSVGIYGGVTERDYIWNRGGIYKTRVRIEIHSILIEWDIHGSGKQRWIWRGFTHGWRLHTERGYIEGGNTRKRNIYGGGLYIWSAGVYRGYLSQVQKPAFETLNHLQNDCIASAPIWRPPLRGCTEYLYIPEGVQYRLSPWA